MPPHAVSVLVLLAVALAPLLAATPARACDPVTGIGCAIVGGGPGGAPKPRYDYGIGVNKDNFGRLTRPTDPSDPVRPDAFGTGLRPGDTDNDLRCNSSGNPEGCK